MVVKQFKYYDEDNHSPEDLTRESLANGSFLNGIEFDEIKIKALPGTTVEVNGTTVVVGDTWNYEIPKRENVVITTIKVIGDFDLIENDSKAYFILTGIQHEG